MSPIAILKLLKAAKEIRDYVKKPNNLDLQSDMFLERLKTLEDNVSRLEIDLKAVLEILKNKANKGK